MPVASHPAWVAAALSSLTTSTSRSRSAAVVRQSLIAGRSAARPALDCAAGEQPLERLELLALVAIPQSLTGCLETALVLGSKRLRCMAPLRGEWSGRAGRWASRD